MPLTPPLSRALCDERPQQQPVAFGRGGERGRGELRERARNLAGAIRAAGGGRWLLCTDDAFAAAIGLVAVAHAGALAVVPPNRQPETLRRLAAGARGAIADHDLPLSGLPVLAPLEARRADHSRPTAPSGDALVAEFYTSGTTGDAKLVRKALRHLEDEVAELESLFGDAVPRSARVFATVSHQHIYGILFRLLWPLATGRPFQSDTLLHPQETLPQMGRTRHSALVSTPAQLKRMSAREGLRQLRGSCHAVFSSGGLLDAEVAKNVASALGAAPWEVLGSTETGGVAVRQRDRDGESWHPMPSVRVAIEEDAERLAVTSPFVSVGEPTGDGCRTFLMGDRARLERGGSFLLLGRSDRTAKVGEKRLSLPEMERDLEGHGWVAEAALVVLEQGGEARVAAVLVPSGEGGSALRAHGRRALRSALVEHLAPRWDRVLLPRAWRFVDTLPRNAQGKLPRGALEELFGPAGDST